MNINCLVLGPLGVNCYLLCENGEGVVIDPGAEYEKIVDSAEKNGCSITKILLTHGHFDHIGAVRKLAESTGAAVYIHSKDEKMLSESSGNLSFLTGETVETYIPDVLLDEIAKIPFGDSFIKVYHTPGHSEGSVSFLWKGNLFCGDLLFQGSIGRYDFGDLNTELNSIKFLIDNFEETTPVFPGHGAQTTIGDEKVYNPYVVNYILD